MTMRDTLRAVGNTAIFGTLALLYPPHCPLCEVALEHDTSRGLRFVCDGCLAQIRRVTPPWCARCGDDLLEHGCDLCERCGHQEIPFECARSFGIYEGVLARLIQLLKFHGERALARELAPLLAQVLEQESWMKLIDAITFVPMSRRSQWARGFNQSELLARQLGTLMDKSVFAALWKRRETYPQVDLSGSERLENLRDAFAPLASARCRSILLLDDVYTTGATVTECSRVLRSAGYQHVYVLTLARTPLGSNSEETKPSAANEHES